MFQHDQVIKAGWLVGAKSRGSFGEMLDVVGLREGFGSAWELPHVRRLAFCSSSSAQPSK